MITLYKLTDKNMVTRKGYENETKWEIGRPVTATGVGGLCTNGVIHCYRHPGLAILLNPVHAGFYSPRLFEAESDGVADEHADKCGVKTLTLTKEIPLPEFSTEQRVTFAIRVALLVYKNERFREWAQRWLSGEDRSDAAARAAAAYAPAAVYAAVYAADAAVYAAGAAAAYAEDAARAAVYAADAAAHATAYAAGITHKDLMAIAEAL